MPKFVEGQVYRLHKDATASGLFDDGYLWIFVGMRELDGGTRHAFKSVATGELEWWPPLWIQEPEGEDPNA